MAEDCGIDGISVMYVSGIINGRKDDLVKSLSSSGLSVQEDISKFQEDEYGDRKIAEIYLGETNIGTIVRSDSEGVGTGPIPEYFLCFNQPIPLPNTTSRMREYLR